MTQPTVCCVMLTNGRQEMVLRSVRAFRAQTYERKTLCVYDTEPRDVDWDWLPDEAFVIDEWETDERSIGRTIGQLRNGANGHVEEDIILHWDSDDWSHPRRIEEQVALLQATEADCVGYREMLAWKTEPVDATVHIDRARRLVDVGGEAWLYSCGDPRYCMGTSLCYWRRAWEAKPFPNTSAGEDTQWQTGLSRISISSLSSDPRMICTIHGANTHLRVVEDVPEWRRVPEWDTHCRSVLYPT